MANEITLKDETTEFLLYTAPNGEVIDNPDDLVIFCSGLSNRHSRKLTNLTDENVYKVEVFFHKENIWLTQKRMAELFGVDRSVITKHLQNIFDSKELDESSVSAKIAHTAGDGKTYQTLYR